MRISRPRLLIRVALLLVASGFLLWKAWGAHRDALASAGTPAAVLLSRVALVETLVAALGLVAAGVAVTALRQRRRTPTLRLGDVAKTDSPGSGERSG